MARIQRCRALARCFPIQFLKAAFHADILDKPVATWRAAVLADLPCVPFGRTDLAPYIQDKRVKTPLSNSATGEFNLGHRRLRQAPPRANAVLTFLGRGPASNFQKRGGRRLRLTSLMLIRRP
jgi:hypothetical protein